MAISTITRGVDRCDVSQTPVAEVRTAFQSPDPGLARKPDQAWRWVVLLWVRLLVGLGQHPLPERLRLAERHSAYVAGSGVSLPQSGSDALLLIAKHSRDWQGTRTDPAPAIPRSAASHRLQGP